MPTEPTPTKRRYEITVFLLAAVALALVLNHPTDDRGEVTVLRGTTRIVSGDRTAIGFEGRRVGGPPLDVFHEDGGFVVAGAHWFDGQSWYDTPTPQCLDPEAEDQPIEMGVLEAHEDHGGVSRAVVVWLKCLQRSVGQ